MIDIYLQLTHELEKPNICAITNFHNTYSDRYTLCLYYGRDGNFFYYFTMRFINLLINIV